jgi:hypothetical protein
MVPRAGPAATSCPAKLACLVAIIARQGQFQSCFGWRANLLVRKILNKFNALKRLFKGWQKLGTTLAL